MIRKSLLSGKMLNLEDKYFLSYAEALIFADALSLINKVIYVEIYTHHVKEEYDDLFCWWGPASIYYGDVRHLSIVKSNYCSDGAGGVI